MPFFIVLIVTIGLCKASAAAYRQEEEILDNEINNEINKSWN